MRSGALRTALLNLAAEERAHPGTIRRQASSFSATAKLVAGFAELDKAVGEKGATSSFFRRFAKAEDSAKSVEKQAEMTNASNDK